MGTRTTGGGVCIKLSSRFHPYGFGFEVSVSVSV